LTAASTVADAAQMAEKIPEVMEMNEPVTFQNYGRWLAKTV
jgi:hypothetical protein